MAKLPKAMRADLIGRHQTKTRLRTGFTSDRASELVEFAVTWRHWGGGEASDIFVQFGISAQEYFERLESILAEGHYSNDPQLRVELIKLCRMRLRSDNANTLGLS